MSRQFNAVGLASLKFSEGCKLNRYTDTAGISTIGYGHTGPLPQVALDLGYPAYPDTLDQMAADWLLWYDVQQFAMKLEPLVPNATDNEWAAMICLAYNIGVGAFRSSSVLRLHLAGNYELAATAFLLWDKDHHDGALVTVPGLLARRQREMGLYLSP